MSSWRSWLGFGGSSDAHDLEMFHLRSIPRFTYRSGFVPIASTGLTSDSGWGCCYRCCQGILANYLCKLEEVSEEVFRAYFVSRSVALACFDDSPISIFSLHKIVLETAKLGVSPGGWAEPSKVATAIVGLMNGIGLSAYVNTTCSIDPEEIESKKFPMFLMISLRCGMHELPREVFAFIRMALSGEGSLGLVSGYSGSAYYVVGADVNDKVVYYDPHVVYPAIVNTAGQARLFEPGLQSMLINQLNPSMLLGFVCKDKEAAHGILHLLSTGPNSPLLYGKARHDLLDQVMNIEDLDI